MAYSLPGAHGRRIFLAVLNPRLRRLFTRAIEPPVATADRDEFDPTVAVDQSTGRVWLCFYLSSSGRRTLATYSCTSSRDGGSRWSRVTSAASVPSDETQAGAYNNGLASEYAAYNGLVAAGGRAHPVWTDTRRLRELGEEIYTTTLR